MDGCRKAPPRQVMKHAGGHYAELKRELIERFECGKMKEGSPSAPTNCGFVTFQQCLDTISGIGGFCVRNNLYQPPPGPHPPKKTRCVPY